MSKFTNFCYWVYINGLEELSVTEAIQQYEELCQSPTTVRRFPEIYNRHLKGLIVRIDLIKLYRETFQVRLGDAKYAIDEYTSNHGNGVLTYDWDGLANLFGCRIENA